MNTTRTTTRIRTVRCGSIDEALELAAASGMGEAIMLNGTPMVVHKDDVYRLSDAGVSFAYICVEDLPSGEERVLLIPTD